MNTNGMLQGPDGTLTPGKVLGLFFELRKKTGIIELKRKQGMKFDTRASTDMFDKVRSAADELNLLIYPHEGTGKGLVVEDGTLADVEMTVVVQSIEDGSLIQIYGYGQGADSQDKAGGKAGTYAFKQALLQGLLAGGTKTPKKDRIPDTDDDDAPIEGGVKPKSSKPKAPALADVQAAFEGATSVDEYKAAVELLKVATPDTQVKLKGIAQTARARCIPPTDADKQ